jgi:uncharacterized protein YndB with AHSA1/START domain
MSTQTIRLAVRASRHEVWDALTDPEVTPGYYYGFRGEFDLSPGGSYRYTAGGGDMITGTVLDVDPGSRLVTTFNGHYAPDVAAAPESTVTITLTDTDPPAGGPGITLVSLVHEGMDGAAASSTEGGWVTILSGLKTLLETGTPLAAPPAA